LLPPVSHKTRGNEEVCQNFGQEWSLLSVPHAELSTAVTGKSERGCFWWSTNSVTHQRFTKSLYDLVNKQIKNKILINYIKSQRLGWFGHVYRMPDERMVKKKVYEWKPIAIRSLERSKNRWENDVNNYLNIMRIRNWKDCIQDRHKWKGIVEKAKTFND
jgi:hypothetical protein